MQKPPPTGWSLQRSSDHMYDPKRTFLSKKTYTAGLCKTDEKNMCRQHCLVVVPG